MEKGHLIFDFTEEGIDKKWMVVNDKVMGVAFLPFVPFPLIFIWKIKQVYKSVTREMEEPINLVFEWKESLSLTAQTLAVEMVGRRRESRLLISM